MVFPLAYLLFTGHLGWRWVLTGLVVLACALVPGRVFAPVVQATAATARRPGWALMAVFSLCFVATASLALRRGLPLPYVHDEFSYLLAGDTFSRGRLTNPTPPCAEHFESMHILVRPTYMSKYPPGQGLFLALGQWLGHPVYGVWICNALAAAAIAWALRAFVPARWALLGGILTAIHPQVLEWGQRYWGGSVGLLGGAILTGAAGRIIRGDGRRNVGLWIVLAVSLLILANSRPFEGAVMALILVGGGFIARRKSVGEYTGPAGVLGAALVLVLGAGWMGYYNYRITGHPLRLPYAEHQKQYAIVPLFIFQDRNAKPAYASREMELFYDREQGYWYARHGIWRKLWEEACANVTRLWLGFFGNVEALAVSMLALPWAMARRRWARWLVGALLVFMAALMAETFMYPHYAAPAAAAMAALTMICMRQLARFRPPIGPILVRAVVAVCVLWSCFWWIAFFNWRQEPGEWQMRRQWIEQDYLGGRSGRHLVFVRYGDHNVHQEWVYNSADLPDAKVVWARDLDAKRNRKLAECYKDRTIWIVEPEGPRREPVRYEP